MGTNSKERGVFGIPQALGLGLPTSKQGRNAGLEHPGCAAVGG